MNPQMPKPEQFSMTDPALLNLLRKAAQHVMTSEEIVAQRSNWARAEIELGRLEQETISSTPATEPAAAAEAGPSGEWSCSLTEQEGAALSNAIGDEEAAEITLFIGDGHGGYGLYVCLTEYPDHGATLITRVAGRAPKRNPPAAQPLPTGGADEEAERELFAKQFGPKPHAFSDVAGHKDWLGRFGAWLARSRLSRDEG